MLDAGFFVVLARMVFLAWSHPNSYHFVDGSGDSHRAALIAGKLSAIDFVSIGHGSISFSPGGDLVCFCHSTGSQELQTDLNVRLIQSA